MKKITLLLMMVLGFSSNINSQVILSENFDDITTLTDWDQVNVSTTIGTTNWFQGNPATTFGSHAGAANSYIGANFNATTGANTISNWLILPVLSLKDDDVLTFYTRTATASTFPDRLQVRISADGDASTPPTNDSDLGSYTTLLLDINPTLAVGGYPNVDWELQTVTITGLGDTPVDARLAFRYFVTNGGPTGSNSNYIGIDTLSVDSTLGIDEFGTTVFSHFYDKNTDLLTLESSTLAFDNIQMFNILGQEVLNKGLSQTSESLSLAQLQDGVYIAKVTIEGQVQTVKFLKQ